MLDALKSIDEDLGVKLHNKGGGFFRRHISDAHLSLCRAMSGYEREEDVFENVNNGALALDTDFDRTLIDRIREDLKPRLLDEETKTVEYEGVELLRTVEIDPSNSDVEQLLDSKEISDKVRSYFGTDYRVSLAWALYYPEIEEDAEKFAKHLRNWHLDTDANPNSLRLLVFLTDQLEEGAFEVVSREKTEQLMDNYSIDEIEQDSSLIDEEDIQRYSGEKGYSILSNVVEQIHRAGSPEKEARMVLIFSFRPSL